MITTERLKLTPETPDLWTIADKNGNTLGQLGNLHGLFSIELSEPSKNLGIATEAACAWIQAHSCHSLTAVIPADKQSLSFLHNLGFSEQNKQLQWQGELPSPQYQQLNQNLSIKTNQLKTPYQASACQLVECGPDVYDRPAKLTPETAKAWHDMQLSATKDGVALQMVSAYRSPKYQADLLQKKLDGGQSIDDILTTNAAPGHSEHHTGRAIDLTTPDTETLEESFDQSPAFHWLQANAEKHGFTLSYPKNNPYGISYEPWHWIHNA